MFGTGRMAKRAGRGSVVKVAIATAAVTAMTVSAAAAGVLPIVSAQTRAADTRVSMGLNPAAAIAAGASAVQAARASVPPASPTSATAGAGAALQPAASHPTITHTDAAPAARPDLSGLTRLPSQVLNCFTPVIDLVKGLPGVQSQQVAAIGPAIVGCVAGIVQTLPLPLGLNGCISQILAFVSHITAQVTTGVPSLGALNVAACVPTGLSGKAGATAGLQIPTPAVPAVALPDLSGLTGLPAQVLTCLTPVLDLVKGLAAAPVDQIAKVGPTVVGCVSGIVQGLPLPSGLNGCISQILAFVSHVTSQVATQVPSVGDLNVAACIPTGIPAGIPATAGALAGSGFMGGWSSFVGAGFPFGAGK